MKAIKLAALAATLSLPLTALAAPGSTVGGDDARLKPAGFSEGAQMTERVGLAKGVRDWGEIDRDADHSVSAQEMEDWLKQQWGGS